MAKTFSIEQGEHPVFVIDKGKRTVTVNGQPFPWFLAESGPVLTGAGDPDGTPVLHLPIIEGSFVVIEDRDG